MSQFEFAVLARIRRGLGLIIFLAGVLHAFEMVIAVMFSLGKLPMLVSHGAWKQMFLGQIMFLVMGPLLYLALNYRATGIFYYEALMDFLIGFAAFTIVLTGTAQLLVSHVLSPWWAFTPSAFLCGYGLFVRSGRSLAPKRPDAAARP